MDEWHQAMSVQHHQTESAFSFSSDTFTIYTTHLIDKHLSNQTIHMWKILSDLCLFKTQLGIKKSPCDPPM